MMRHWNRGLYVFVSTLVTYLWFFIINIRISEPSSVELRKNLYLVKRSEIATFRRMYFGTEWTRTLSIWSLIHYFFSLQQSWHTQDHQIKKKQPGTMRIDILASILFFEVIWIPTHDPHFRVIHFFFFVSFSEILSHVELIYRPRVGTLRWKIDLLASKIWFTMWNAAIRRKFHLQVFS